MRLLVELHNYMISRSKTVTHIIMKWQNGEIDILAHKNGEIVQVE